MRLMLIFFLATAIIGVTPEEVEEEEEDDEEDETEPPPPDGPPLVPMCELVTSYGYKCEEHLVTTKDGYILELYRVPTEVSPPGPVVLLGHGLMCSSELFVLKNISIAYQLSDQGNDVWILNTRGTVHGRKHTTLNPDKDEQFWDLSWQDMGEHDLPAIIEYIKEKTLVKQLSYVGHSQGTMIFFTMLSSVPELANSIKDAILLAPVYYATKYQFMLKEGSSMVNMLHETMNGFKEKKLWEAFPRMDIPSNEHQIGCKSMPDMAVGYCNMGFEMAKPVIGDFMPAGTSRKNIEHFAQVFTNGKIKYYDYGSEDENKKRYGNSVPPEIDASKALPCKIHVFYAESDQVVAPQDADALSKDIKNIGTIMHIEEESFNHADFLFPLSEENEKPFESMMIKMKELLKS